MNTMLSLQRLALPLTFAQLAFAANTFSITMSSNRPRGLFLKCRVRPIAYT